MGIQVEFNPDLALRNIAEFKAGRREEAECIPATLEVGRSYPFLKQGQRNYWLHGELPLLETQGNALLSRPRASIVILEATHFLRGEKTYTKGMYRIVEVFSDEEIHFESYARVKPSPA